MSYALIPWTRLRGLGASVSADFSAAASTPAAKTAANDACAKARITGGRYPDIDNLVVSCCQDIQKGSGSAGDKAKGVAVCIAKGTAKVAGAVAGATAATALCAAAGTVTAGITAALAASGVCGAIGAVIGSVVGGWVYDRVAGYSTGQKIAGAVGGVVCGIVSGGIAASFCAFAAAELVGWISDELGPVVEGIFHPGAKAERERAARAAFHALDERTAKYRNDADDAMRSLWSQSISSIKAMYQQSIGLLGPSYQAEAIKILGFSPTYDGIAKAFVAAGGASTPLHWAADQSGHTVGDRLRANHAGGGSGCESTAVGCLHDGYSEVCPFSFNDYYMAFWNLVNWKGTGRDTLIAFDNKMLAQMQAIAGGIFDGTQQAISNVVAQIMTTATLLKQQEFQDQAKAANEARLLASASKAAAKAQAAAKQATSWSSDVREQALARAEEQYNIAKQARALLLYAGSTTVTASAASVQKMAGYVASAQAALALANKNAAHAQLMVGAAAATGVAAAGYLLMRMI